MQDRTRAIPLADRGALDSSAFRELFFLYSEELHTYAARLLGSTAEARDVVQVVFEHLWRRRDEWQAAGDARAYLYQAVRHRALDELKRCRVRRRHIEEEWHKRLDVDVAQGTRQNGFPAPDARLQERELRALIDRAIEGLPARQHEAFVLVNQQGLGYDEAAQVMGITASTVAVHIHKALQQLREAVEPVRPGA